jgi:hypothetical protein
MVRNIIARKGGTMKIGIGGHQDLGGPETFEFLTTSFRRLLQESKPTCVYSALAKGADQLLMQVALELDVPVEAVIPCKDYENNYLGHDRKEYWRFYHAALAHHLLAFPECRGRAYEAAGHWIVEQSDLTVLAWNGKPPAGRGGTADMAHYARFLEKSCLHLHTLDYTATLYQFSHSPSVSQEGSEGTVLIVPVVQGKKELVFLIEKTSQIGFPRALQIEQAALQQALRRDMGYQAGHFEVLGSLEASGKVEIVVASDLIWAPIPSEQPTRVHTRKLTDALAQSQERGHFDQMTTLALSIYARSREMQS